MSIVFHLLTLSSYRRSSLVAVWGGSYSGRALAARSTSKGTPMYVSPTPSVRRMHEDSARGIDTLLWLAAGAAWAIVALRAWSQTKKVEARRRTFVVSDRLLKQVFP